MDLDRIREIIIGFALVTLIAAAGAIALSDFQTNERSKTTTSVINESVGVSGGSGTLSQPSLFISVSACRNSTAGIVTLNTYCNVTGNSVIVNTFNFSDNIAYVDYVHYTPTNFMNITTNGLVGIDNTTSYFGTAGTIAGVALLLTIVIGAFYFVTRRTA